VGVRRSELADPLTCQYLYFCTSKASKGAPDVVEVEACCPRDPLFYELLLGCSPQKALLRRNRGLNGALIKP
jgi:hypothetical protein